MNAGSGIAVVNVTFTNNLDENYLLERENFCIRIARDKCAMEHGGNAAPEGEASRYLRFPLKFIPGEIKTGLVVFILETGTDVNNLVLRDGTGKMITQVDLYRIYTYA